MKNIAILGSSGGNLYSLGGKYPKQLLTEIIAQADAAKMNNSVIQFIGAEASMYKDKEHTKASMIKLSENKPTSIFERSLKETNAEDEQIDQDIAKKIKSGEIYGLILISVHTAQANKQAVLAAAEMKIPIVGTG